MARERLERALAFLAGETEYVTLERTDGGYTVRLGDHGSDQLADGTGSTIDAAVTEALWSVRERAEKTVEMADAVMKLPPRSTR